METNMVLPYDYPVAPHRYVSKKVTELRLQYFRNQSLDDNRLTEKQKEILEAIHSLMMAAPDRAIRFGPNIEDLKLIRNDLIRKYAKSSSQEADEFAGLLQENLLQLMPIKGRNEYLDDDPFAQKWLVRNWPRYMARHGITSVPQAHQ
jgi:hypothetical protein